MEGTKSRLPSLESVFTDATRCSAILLWRGHPLLREVGNLVCRVIQSRAVPAHLHPGETIHLCSTKGTLAIPTRNPCLSLLRPTPLEFSLLADQAQGRPLCSPSLGLGKGFQLEAPMFKCNFLTALCLNPAPESAEFKVGSLCFLGFFAGPCHVPFGIHVSGRRLK